MKVPLSVRNFHKHLSESYLPLQKRVDDLFSRIKEPRWHYESRLKPETSFALKLETGRFNPSQLEDFFAATIVVQNSLAIQRAKDLILQHFDLAYSKPGSPDITHKRAECFPFDDLRLYLKLKEPSELPKTPLSDLLFELQIRTFLQHAWSIATHDLIYKSTSTSWAKERIAYQIKAMLEHAELSIQQAEEFSKAPELAKTTKEKESISQVIALIRDEWKEHELPSDLNRLAENIQGICEASAVPLSRLSEILKQENAQGRGSQTLHLSPYCVVVQSLINHKVEGLTKKFSGRYSKIRFLLTSEIEIPDGFDLEMANVVKLQPAATSTAEDGK